MGDDDLHDFTKPSFTCDLITQPYRIARFPVTVGQYRAFIDDHGYEDRGWWTADGWTWRAGEEIGGPRSFDAPFQTPNHPQIGVSWYEAMAFCAWLSDRLGRPILLPNEAQWERAARHTDGRDYPWGSRRRGCPTLQYV